jgi:hypothetical protein
MYSGLFSGPRFEFPGKTAPPTLYEINTYGGLLLPGDLLTATAIAAGTKYISGHILVTSVTSEDVITVGVILQCVIRKNNLLFIVSMNDAVRTNMKFFHACPQGKVDIVNYAQLSDFKPLVKRDHNTCFRFVLHHHLPVPLDI